MYGCFGSSWRLLEPPLGGKVSGVWLALIYSNLVSWIFQNIYVNNTIGIFQ